MEGILEYFDLLVGHGFKIIPLRASSKRPLCAGWTDWDRAKCRYSFNRYPDCNIGILLGDIVDVEGDSEEANDKICNLIGSAAHPQYSSSKSTHHFFINPDPTLTIFKFNDIEFRGHRHQSVIPPSSFIGGVTYQWLDTFDYKIPPMPSSLLKYYWMMRRKGKSDLKPGHKRITCSVCAQKAYIHKKRFALELISFRDMGRNWECHKCRTVDLRSACRKLRKKLEIEGYELAK
jgi:hypothetical protein